MPGADVRYQQQMNEWVKWLQNLMCACIMIIHRHFLPYCTTTVESAAVAAALANNMQLPPQSLFHLPSGMWQFLIEMIRNKDFCTYSSLPVVLHSDKAPQSPQL